MFFYRFGPSITNNIIQSPPQHSKPGDLIFDGEWYYLNLGDEIARPEQWYTNQIITISQNIPSLCHNSTITFIHRMVNERFSSYNKVIPLFFWSDITLLLKHKKHPLSVRRGVRGEVSQQLFLFPSILSIQQYLNNHPEINSSLVLSWSSTTVQKAKAYRSLSNNTEQTLLCTHSQIFQNRHNLTHIHVMDPYSPYYHTFQEPRYTITTVIEKMKEIYTTNSL